MTIKKVFHWFWAWEDEKEEVWLKEMSQSGWHFKSVGFPSNYSFEDGEQKEYIYRLDYFVNPKERANYLQIFKDGGWEHLGNMSASCSFL